VSSESFTVCALQNTYKKPPVLKNVKFIPVKYKTFGTGQLFKLLKIEMATPSYIQDYGVLLRKVQPNVIISLDFFRLSFWQSLRYAIRNPNIKVFIFSETKRLPKNSLSRIGMHFFVWLLRRNVKHVAGILVWTIEGELFLKKMFPSMSIVTVPAPVDTALFVPNREEVFYKDLILRIICNARYSSYKRHQDLFTAVAKLIANGRKVQVTCIGRADSGRQKVEKMAQQSGVCEVVTFLDSVPQAELVKLYNSHDVLVLPSYNEAIGMVVPEAMACGIPTITSDTVGANVYVREGETGLIYTTGDVPELVQALDTLFDRSLLERMGAAAEQTIQESFTLQKCQERFRVALGLSDLA
jgi:glycosyltransferase involved in cell wall biosynthesis